MTVPTALPFVFTGLRLASSLAVISAVVAEYFGGPRTGIGSFITTAAAGSNYSRAWAFVVGGIILGLAFYAVTLALESVVRHRTGPRAGQGRGAHAEARLARTPGASHHHPGRGTT